MSHRKFGVRHGQETVQTHEPNSLIYGMVPVGCAVALLRFSVSKRQRGYV